jgi:hypothetical protein
MQKFRTMVQEIIERKRAEQALRESEERFRNMADTAPVTNWVTGPDKRFTFFTIFPSRGRDPPSWGGKGRKVAYGAVNFIIYHAGPMQPFTIAELDRYLERRRERDLMSHSDGAGLALPPQIREVLSEKRITS